MQEIKLDWMLNELEEDGFETTENEVVDILKGENLEDYNPALVDYVLEMESEWASEGNH